MDPGAGVFFGRQGAQQKQLADERDQLYQKLGQPQVKNYFLRNSLGVED